MPDDRIQWFPGHMAKARRLIAEDLRRAHLVIETADARVPLSSRNPELDRLIGDRPRILLLNKASLADPEKSRAFRSLLSRRGEGGAAETVCLLCDCVTGEGLPRLPGVVRALLSDRAAAFERRGQPGRRLRAMVVGVPNTGKSTLINRLSGGNRLRTEDRPGVTRVSQWVTTRYGVDLLDTPGVLWPRFDSRTVGENLALTGAIRDGVTDAERLSAVLLRRLRRLYPDALAARYGLAEDEPWRTLPERDLLLLIGQKRGCLAAGGAVDAERTARLLLSEFRSGRIGRVTLDELPNGRAPGGEEADDRA